MLPGQKELAKKYLLILKRCLRNAVLADYNPLVLDGENAILELDIAKYSEKDKDLPSYLKVFFSYEGCIVENTKPSIEEKSSDDITEEGEQKECAD